jgi:hypothetical protein
LASAYRIRCAALLLSVTVPAFPAGAAADERPGELTGWVEDDRGSPISGALISLFGKAIGGSGLITFSDSSGRFFLPAVPAGSYTLRALANEDLTAPARRITVLPNRQSIFTLSLAPNPEAEREEAEATEAATPKGRELRWLLRHKRRSVLEDRDHLPWSAPASAAATTSLASSLGDLGGTLEIVANPERPAPGGSGEDESGLVPSSLGVVRLTGRFGDVGRWTLGGLLTESEKDTWRMAGEVVVEPGNGHTVRAGTGYGTRLSLPPVPASNDGRRDNHRYGAIFVEDRWQLGDRLTTSAGARYSHIGFLKDSHYVDPAASLDFRPDPQTTLRGGVMARTLPPGGDLLTLSALASSTALVHALMDDQVRAEKVVRYDLSVDRTVGQTAVVGTHVFYETVNDALVNAYGGSGSLRSLRVINGPALATRGAGVTVARSFGKTVRGSVTYTYGQAKGEENSQPNVIQAYPDGEFHDVVARVETVIERSDTRLRVYYRINSLSGEPEDDSTTEPLRTNRFDLQLSQGIPFLASFTSAEWDLLVALRNVFYEPDAGGTLDEMAVFNPPTRVLGGISVSF